MVRVLFFGQKPPPHVGQFILIERMLNARFSSIQLKHIDMSFSKDLEAIGKFSFKKMFTLMLVLLRVISARFTFKPQAIYFPSGGGSRSGVYRDIVVLLGVRLLFNKICLHFHSGGIHERYIELSKFWKKLFAKAFFGVDLAIISTEANIKDCEAVFAKRVVVIPLGIQDEFSYRSKEVSKNERQILFVGMLTEAKGVFDLLDALGALKSKDIHFTAKFVGGFIGHDEERAFYNSLEKHDLVSDVIVSGVLLDELKWDSFQESAIFCLPSHYETFGLAVVEAMQFGLPVVATSQGGLSYLIQDERNGFLVSLGDTESLVASLERLLVDSDLKIRMGKASRKLFMDCYSEDVFHSRFERAITNLVRFSR